MRVAMEHRKLVRRTPSRPLVWLGDAKERDVPSSLGERFPAYPVKEKDFVFAPPSRRS